MTTDIQAQIVEVLAAHIATVASISFGGTTSRSGNARRCVCGFEVEAFHDELHDDEPSADRLLNERFAAHQAEQLSQIVRGLQAKAWKEGHRTPVQRGPSGCRCGAWDEGECACGKYGTGKILTPNPYRTVQVRGEA